MDYNLTPPESSPYYEAFKSKSWEVIFTYNNMDDFSLTNIGEFNGKKIVSAEAAKIESETAKTESDLTKQQVDELCGYMREVLSSRVSLVRVCRICY